MLRLLPVGESWCGGKEMEDAGGCPWACYVLERGQESVRSGATATGYEAGTTGTRQL